MEKPIRNAVTVGLLVECFFTFTLLVHSTTSVHHIYGLPNRPYATNGRLWIAFCPHWKKGEERSIQSHLSLSFVAFAQMSCLIV